MQALKQEVYISDKHQLNINVPEDIPTGLTEVFLIFQAIGKKQPSKKRLIGAAKGQIQISDDFDEPLPDEIVKGFYS